MGETWQQNLFKRKPASPVVLFNLAISCSGMLEFDPKGQGRLNYIFYDHCGHHSLEWSWSRKKGCFTTWLPGGTQSPKLVWPPLTSAQAACVMDSDTVLTTGEGIFKASSSVSTCYWYLCSQVLGIFTEISFTSRSVAAITVAAGSGNTGRLVLLLTHCPGNVLSCFKASSN